RCAAAAVLHQRYRRLRQSSLCPLLPRRPPRPTLFPSTTLFRSYALEAQAREVLHGLGFEDDRIDGDVGALSGGWKMRVNIAVDRSEEHTSELQLRGHLVCRLLLEKKNTRTSTAQAALCASRTSC